MMKQDLLIVINLDNLANKLKYSKIIIKINLTSLLAFQKIAFQNTKNKHI